MTEDEKDKFKTEVVSELEKSLTSHLKDVIKEQHEMQIATHNSMVEARQLHSFRCAALSGIAGNGFKDELSAQYAEKLAQAMLKIAKGDK